MRLDQAVELAVSEVLLLALVVLILCPCGSVVSLFNSCIVVHEQHSSATAELGASGVEEMAEKVAEADVPLGSSTTGCSLSLVGTGGNFERMRASIDGAVGKHSEVRDVGVVGLLGSVRVKVMAVAANDALCELVVVDFLGASGAKSVEMRHGDGLAAEHE
eukprot:6210327-Pleurochrysis_carterae.AAC.1